MAKAIINLQKESGGIVKLSPADGTGITEVTLPESGELATKQYVDASVKDDQVASEVPVTPAGNLSSNTVQSALEEIQAEADLLNSTKANLVGGNDFTGPQTIDGSGVLTQAELAGAIGNINSPLLDLPLQNSLSMKAGVGSVTFERSTTATYIDRYGVLQYAGIDEPRFEKDGLLIEGSSTNLCTYSNDFDNGVWLKNNATITPNNAVAPDGTTTAHTFVRTASGLANIEEIGIQVTAGNTYTVSCWLKGDGIQTFGFGGFEIGSAVIERVIEVTPPSTWTRYSVTFTVADGSTTFNLQPIRYFAGTITSIDLWGAQIEELPFASSYIPTTDSAVTRSADVCSVTLDGNSTAVLDDHTVSFSVKPHYITQGAGSPSCNVYYRDGAIYEYCEFSWSGFLTRREAGLRLESGSNLIGEMHKHTVVFKATSFSQYRDGVLKNTWNDVPVNGLAQGTSYSIGTIKSTDIGKHIKNFKIWDKALSAVEVSLA